MVISIKRMGSITIALFLAIHDFMAIAFADPSPPRKTNTSEAAVQKGTVGFDQRLGVTIPDDRFVNENGESVSLREIARNRPLILVLAYYKCPSLCSIVLNGIFNSLKKQPYKAGQDYSLAVVSIDPREDRKLAARKKSTYLSRYPGLGDANAIHFLTGEQTIITRLTQRVGFRYFYDAKADEYTHPGGVILVNNEGKVSSYLFGIQPAQRDLRLALVDASEGRVGKPIDKFLLYCYRYDAKEGTYSFTIQRIVRFLGGGTVLGIAFMIGWFLRSERRGPRKKRGGER